MAQVRTIQDQMPHVYQKGICSGNRLHSQFGIDKLRIFTEHFQLDSIEQWNVKQPVKKAGQAAADERILCNVNGTPYHGDSAFVNFDTFNVDLHHGKLFITFNPSKLHGSLTADTNAIDEQVKQIRAQLNETLSADFLPEASRVSWIDYAVDAEMQHTVPAYRDLLTGAKRRANTQEALYPSSVRYGNGNTWQLCAYDKGKKNAIDAGMKHPPDTNYMRNEIRYRSAAKIQETAPFVTYGQLLETPLTGFHSMYMRATANFLKLQQQQVTFPKYDYTALQQVLIDCIVKHPHSYIHAFLAALCGEIDAIGDVSKLIKETLIMHYQSLGKKAPHRVTLSNKVKDFNDAIRAQAAHRVQLQKDSERNSFLKLTELNEKFIIPYKTA